MNEKYLPAKTELTVLCKLTEEQIDLYRQVWKANNWFFRLNVSSLLRQLANARKQMAQDRRALKAKSGEKGKRGDAQALAWYVATRLRCFVSTAVSSSRSITLLKKLCAHPLLVHHELSNSQQPQKQAIRMPEGLAVNKVQLEFSGKVQVLEVSAPFRAVHTRHGLVG